MADLYRYAAFISYSSKDASFAKRLHRALEAFSIPSSLGTFDVICGGKKNRIYPVFRDREELAAGALGEVIEASLRASAALIVVCSPNAAASPWVQKEIEYFASLGRADKVFAIVGDNAPPGDVAANFPPAFQGDALAGDKLQPLAGDARRNNDGFRNAWLKIVAGIVGVSPGQLIDRDAKRRGRQRLTAAGAVLGLSLLALSGAWLAARSVAAASANRSTLLAAASSRLTSDVDRHLAIRVALASDPAAQQGWIERWFNPSGYASARDALVTAVTHNRIERVVEAGGPVLSAAWSPDGRFFATSTEFGEVRVWQADGGEELARFPVRGMANSVVFSPDGARVLVGSDDEAIVWPSTGGAALATFDVGGVVRSAVFSPEGTHVLAGGSNGVARIWPVNGGAPLATFQVGSPVYAVGFSPDGARVIVGSIDGKARVLPASGGAALSTFDVGGHVTSVTFSPDGTRVLTGSNAFPSVARLWRSSGGTSLAMFELDGDPTTTVFSPDGSRVLTASFDGRAQIWPASGGAAIETFETDSPVNVAAFSPDGRRVLIGSRDGIARIWRTAPQGALTLAAGSPIRAIALSPDGSHLIAGGDDGKARLWLVAGGSELATFDVGSPVRSVAFSADGSRVLISSGSGRIGVWRVGGGQALAVFDAGNAGRLVSFSADGEASSSFATTAKCASGPLQAARFSTNSKSASTTSRWPSPPIGRVCWSVATLARRSCGTWMAFPWRATT